MDVVYRKNNAASSIVIQHANEVEEAWMGYSPVWLTGKAKNTYTIRPFALGYFTNCTSKKIEDK